MITSIDVMNLGMLQLQGAAYHLHADYLVAADGASSRIRKQLGIQMIGEPALQHLVNIHFFSKELWHHLKERPAMLYFVFSSQAIVVLVAHNLQEGEMVAQVSVPRTSKIYNAACMPMPCTYNTVSSLIHSCGVSQTLDPPGCTQTTATDGTRVCT